MVQTIPTYTYGLPPVSTRPAADHAGYRSGTDLSDPKHLPLCLYLKHNEAFVFNLDKKEKKKKRPSCGGSATRPRREKFRIPRIANFGFQDTRQRGQ